MSPEHRAQLTRWRASAQAADRTCRILFGIGLDTLQRVEAGEVEPDDEVAERIIKHLAFVALADERASQGAAGNGVAPTWPADRVTPRISMLLGRPVPGIFGARA